MLSDSGLLRSSFLKVLVDWNLKSSGTILTSEMERKTSNHWSKLTLKNQLAVAKTYQEYIINEPPRGKTNNVVSAQVRHKPACTSTEKN